MFISRVRGAVVERRGVRAAGTSHRGSSRGLYWRLLGAGGRGGIHGDFSKRGMEQDVLGSLAAVGIM